MTTYLDYFIQQRFTTHSSPEYFRSDFQATRGDGILNEVDHQLLLDINDKIIDLAKKDIESGCMKNTHDTNLRILGRLKYGVTLVKAEKAFIFSTSKENTLDGWIKKSDRITEEPDGTIKLFNGTWVFSFREKVKVGAFDFEKKTLEVKPLFVNFNKSTRNYEPFSSGEEEMEAILAHKSDYPCVCNFREEIEKELKAVMYGKCCKPELFARSNRFGVCEVNILQTIGEKIDSLGAVSMDGASEREAHYKKIFSIVTGSIFASHGGGLEIFFVLLANVPIAFKSKPSEEAEAQHSMMTKEIDLYLLKKGIRRPLWVVRDHEGMVIKAAFSSEEKMKHYKDALIMLNTERELKKIADLMDKLSRSYPNFLGELSKTVGEWEELSKGNKKNDSSSVYSCSQSAIPCSFLPSRASDRRSFANFR